MFFVVFGMVETSIAVLEGDGIGPEIMNEALKSLDAVEKRFGHRFHRTTMPFGGSAYISEGNSYPDRTREFCMSVNSVLKGPLGFSLEEMAKVPPDMILERTALLPNRKDMGVYACYRPGILPKEFAFFSPLKESVIGEGIDILMIREMLGGNYFGDKIDGEENGMQFAVDVGRYDREQVERIARVAFNEARERGCQLTNVNKPNVMATGRFWNAIVDEIAGGYTDVKLTHVIVDNMAAQLVMRPTSYNGVVLLENMQGDILTDELGGVMGSLGLTYSAILNPETGKGIYEPAHGSAPDIAGRGIANPYSMIGSMALMLEHGFGLNKEAEAVWKGLKNVFGRGYLTSDLAGNSPTPIPPEKIVTSSRFGDMVRDSILAT